jgi:hypothetical protein
LTSVGPNGLFAADLILGDVVDDDGLPEIAVGRIPATSADELYDYVDKLIQFEAQAVTRQVVLLADNPDGGVGDFPADSDRISALVPSSYQTQHLYLSHMSTDQARAALFDSFDAGVTWINYIGHGGVDRFAGEGLLTAADVSSLGNTVTPIVSALTCVSGRYEIPGFASLGEALVLEPGGGAIAVFAPSGLSVNRQAVLLDEALFRRVFQGDALTLGDAVLQALADVSGLFSSTDAFETYNILGDPALLLP